MVFMHSFSQLGSKMSNPTLPPDLIHEITSRISPTEVTRFKITSKSWNALISSPLFINDSYLHALNKNERMFLFDEQIFFPPISYELSDPLTRSFYRNVIDDDPPKEVVAHCRGLVCEATQDDRYFINNPLTEKEIQVPTAHIEWDPKADWCSSFFGMGFQKITNSNHLLRVLFFQAGDVKTQVDVYSTRTNMWTRLSPFRDQMPSGKFVVWVRGLIFFQVYKPHSVSTKLVTFNLENYSWGTIDLPPEVADSEFSWEIGALDDHTLVVYPLSPVYNMYGVFNLWLLQGYGKNQEWKLVHIELNPVYHMPHRFTIQPLHFVKPKGTKILFRKDPCGTFGTYYLINQSWHHVAVSENLLINGYCRIHNIVQTLASPIP